MPPVDVTFPDSFSFSSSDWTPTNNQLNNTNRLYCSSKHFQRNIQQILKYNVCFMCIIFDRMEDGLICVSLLLNDKIIIQQRSRISVPICINFCKLRFLNVQPIFKVSRFVYTLTFDNTFVPYYNIQQTHTHTHRH